jgi:hypothetical protein
VKLEQQILLDSFSNCSSGQLQKQHLSDSLLNSSSLTASAIAPLRQLQQQHLYYCTALSTSPLWQLEQRLLCDSFSKISSVTVLSTVPLLYSFIYSFSMAAWSTASLLQPERQLLCDSFINSFSVSVPSTASATASLWQLQQQQEKKLSWKNCAEMHLETWQKEYLYNRTTRNWGKFWKIFIFLLKNIVARAAQKLSI